MNMNYGFYVSRFLKVQMTLTLQDMIFLFSTYQKVNPKFTLFLSRKSNSVNSINKKIEKNQIIKRVVAAKLFQVERDRMFLEFHYWNLTLSTFLQSYILHEFNDFINLINTKETNKNINFIWHLFNKLSWTPLERQITGVFRGYGNWKLG